MHQCNCNLHSLIISREVLVLSLSKSVFVKMWWIWYFGSKIAFLMWKYAICGCKSKIYALIHRDWEKIGSVVSKRRANLMSSTFSAKHLPENPPKNCNVWTYSSNTRLQDLCRSQPLADKEVVRCGRSWQIVWKLLVRVIWKIAEEGKPPN